MDLQRFDHSEGREESGWYRAALAGGLAFAFLMFTSVFVVGAPQPDLRGTGETLRAWAVGNHTALVLSSYLQLAADACFLFFLAGLYVALRRAEGGSGLLAHAALAGGIATITVSFVRLAGSVAFIYVAEGGSTPEVLRALDMLTTTTQGLLAFPQGVFWAAASLAMLRTRVVPRWIGILGAVGAVALFTSTGLAFDPESALGLVAFLAFPLFATWMLATTITLLRRAGAPRTAPQPQVATV